MKSTRCTLTIAVLVVVGVIVGLGSALAAGCPSCGCQAGHCSAGVSAHLTCGRATPAEKQTVVQRREKLSTAVDDAIKSGTQDCNKLVQDVAESMGYGAFKTNNLKADGIIEYLFSPARVETSMKEGWTFLTKGDDEKPRALTVDDAINMANAGQLVVGIMHSKLLNQLKSPADNDGRNYTHGHVFVVSPGGKAASSPEDTFRGMPVANAGNGMIAKKTTGNYVIPGWIRKPQHHEIVAFVALIRR